MNPSSYCDTVKVGIVNTTAFIVSFTDIETAIRVAGLLAALVYTCLKIIEWFQDKRCRSTAKKEEV